MVRHFCCCWRSVTGLCAQRVRMCAQRVRQLRSKAILLQASNNRVVHPQQKVHRDRCVFKPEPQHVKHACDYVSQP